MMTKLLYEAMNEVERALDEIELMRARLSKIDKKLKNISAIDNNADPAHIYHKIRPKIERMSMLMDRYGLSEYPEYISSSYIHDIFKHDLIKDRIVLAINKAKPFGVDFDVWVEEFKNKILHNNMPALYNRGVALGSMLELENDNNYMQVVVGMFVYSFEYYKDDGTIRLKFISVPQAISPTTKLKTLSIPVERCILNNTLINKSFSRYLEGYARKTFERKVDANGSIFEMLDIYNYDLDALYNIAFKNPTPIIKLDGDQDSCKYCAVIYPVNISDNEELKKKFLDGEELNDAVDYSFLHPEDEYVPEVITVSKDVDSHYTISGYSYFELCDWTRMIIDDILQNELEREENNNG